MSQRIQFWEFAARALAFASIFSSRQSTLPLSSCLAVHPPPHLSPRMVLRLSLSTLGLLLLPQKRLGSRSRILRIFFHILPRRSGGQASSFSWPGYIEIAQSSREGDALDLSPQRPCTSRSFFLPGILSYNCPLFRPLVICVRYSASRIQCVSSKTSQSVATCGPRYTSSPPRTLAICQYAAPITCALDLLAHSALVGCICRIYRYERCIHQRETVQGSGHSI